MCRPLNSSGRSSRRRRFRARHRLTHSQLERLDIFSKRFEVKLAKLCEVLSQLLGQIDSPSRLKNPHRVPRLESEGLNGALKFLRETFSREGPRWIASRRYVASATEKLLEAGGMNLQRNRTLVA